MKILLIGIPKISQSFKIFYGFSNDLLIKQVSEPIETLWKRMLKITKTLSFPYKKLIQLIIKNHENKIKMIPASLDSHYPIKGGFLKHIVTMIEMAVEILPNYPDLDRNLVLSASRKIKGKVKISEEFTEKDKLARKHLVEFAKQSSKTAK